MNRRSTSLITTWHGVKLRIRFTPDWRIDGNNRIELVVISPSGRGRANAGTRAPMPITENGYLAHDVSDGSVTDVHGALAFIIAWLDREADTQRWRNAEARRAQFDLFD